MCPVHAHRPVQVRLLHHSVARLESMPLPSDYDDRRMLESWQDNVRGSDAWLVGRRGPEWWTGEAHTTCGLYSQCVSCCCLHWDSY